MASPSLDPWLPATHEDLYNARVTAQGGDELWVLARLHLTGGWCVETRSEGPDGPLLDRSWCQSGQEATETVDARRDQLSHADRPHDVLKGRLLEPPNDQGVIVLHGLRWSRAPGTATVDALSPMPICCVVWARPGPHELTWLTAAGAPYKKRSTELTPVQVIHRFPYWTVGAAREHVGSPSGVPPWHRCRASTLRYEGTMLQANGDLRTITRRTPH